MTASPKVDILKKYKFKKKIVVKFASNQTRERVGNHQEQTTTTDPTITTTMVSQTLY